MKAPNFLVAGFLFAAAFSASAQLSTPPANDADREAAYNTAVENRTTAILTALEISDAAKSNKVHGIIIAQYRTLRARDEKIDAKLKADGKEVNFANRAGEFVAQSKPLHEKFLADLSAELTPAQIETVKDKMTYNKVKVTADAYEAIIPGLTADDKTKIHELLKTAREEAVDGGNAGEKSEIFQKYKDEINAYLNAHGHDVAKAYKDWETRQAATKKD